MLMRECSAKHPIKLFRSPYGVKEVAEIGHLPATRFCTVSHNKVIVETDSFPEAEIALTDECAKHHTQEQKQHGRFKIGKHKMVNHVMTSKDITQYIVLCARPIGGSTNVDIEGAITWRELS